MQRLLGSSELHVVGKQPRGLQGCHGTGLMGSSQRKTQDGPLETSGPRGATCLMNEAVACQETHVASKTGGFLLLHFPDFFLQCLPKQEEALRCYRTQMHSPAPNPAPKGFSGGGGLSYLPLPWSSQPERMGAHEAQDPPALWLSCLPWVLSYQGWLPLSIPLFSTWMQKGHFK